MPDINLAGLAGELTALLRLAAPPIGIAFGKGADAPAAAL